MQNKVIIEGLRIYAYHGVMEQERQIGAYFTIALEATTLFASSMNTDDLTDTVSYADLFQIIQQEMAIPSQLLEHVAGRIAHTILAKHPSIQSLRLKILKENPPMGADCIGAGVEITLP